GHGHGTHVAGTIAQSTNNKYGVAGLSYGAAIMPLRVLNNKGFGQVADIADSIRFAADNGADVINMSLGGPLPTAVMSSAIKYAHKKGVTIVAAAGNGGKRKPSYPAAYKHVIAVAATQFDRSTTFYSQWGEYVDIAAPGGNTRVDQNGDGRPDGVLQETLKDGQTDRHDFLLYMGTSMASPHVAAGAALVIEQGITNPNKVEQILKKTADDSEKKRYKNKKEFKERYGAGIMQADAAAKQAVTDQGVGRMASVLALIGIALFGTRRRNWLVGSAGATGIFSMSAIMSGVGL
ncbi:MAG: S8 family serine peptidase, partial [Gammaproteobacteria bacterium]|nr:S8 family serine peptidase [Gammaproteobacteria bacterium]NIR92519.1 S8 family serine peptidase [Gammaproteobacteria bacterium]